MELLGANILILAIATAALPFLKEHWRGPFACCAVLANALLAGYCGIRGLSGNGLDLSLAGNAVTGALPLRVDALSGWFLLLINFTSATAAMYGVSYMRAYRGRSAEITIHWVAYLWVQASLTFACVVQNTLVFLLVWEVMALATFLLVIFEYQKEETLRAGINYLVQAHLSVVFLTVAFLLVAAQTGSYDFRAVADFCAANPPIIGLILWLCLFVGFSFKAGFVPFHTWLPYAHPAAPTHVSAVMSGVITKIGIYGILRLLLLVKTDYTVAGNFVLFAGIFTGVYGVMLAILQKNIKKLLAYSSIENIGIIGTGIGLGMIGLGQQHPWLTAFGFSGALLHAWNHSLFKSLLFFGAGCVYQATHRLNMEQLGGLVKTMPRTAVLFLLGALAICGLPPFNGFVSEFLIYLGLMKGLTVNTVAPMTLLSALFGLAIIGGLAMLTFTKALGLTFFGSPRQAFVHEAQEADFGKHLPMMLTLAAMLTIGLAPFVFLKIVEAPLALFMVLLPQSATNAGVLPAASGPLTMVSLGAVGFVVLAGSVYFLRSIITAKRPAETGATWGCGYVGDAGKMQYTGNSFVRSFRKLVEPALLLRQQKQEVSGIFPSGEGGLLSAPYDKVEHVLVDLPQRFTYWFF